MDLLQGLRARRPRQAPGPDAASAALSWIGDERIAISGVPSPQAVAHLAEQGVTHVVNCRPRVPVRWSGDLAAERAAFGLGRVACPDARSRPAAAALGVGGGVLRRAGAG